jgi:hypothetical protein
VAVPASGSGTVTASSTVTPRPGANLAAVLSSGARPFYGSGTLTFVCEGRAVGFAHPFTAAGPMTMGAADGNAIAVVNDPTLGPWKLMTLGASYGKIDQDRFAGTAWPFVAFAGVVVAFVLQAAAIAALTVWAVY